MRPAESFLGQPIRDLQTMLRVLAKSQNRPEPLIPDGIYGPDTMQAVSDFQKAHGLPPTGAADQATWEAIRAEFLPARIELVPACPLCILMNANQVIRRGDRCSSLYLVQAVLTVLSQQFLSIPAPSFTGLMDEQTVRSLQAFQTLAGLPDTGELDKLTWKHLALQFPLAAARDRPDPDAL